MLRFLLDDLFQHVVARLNQVFNLLVELNARPGIGCRIEFLSVIEGVAVPIGELLALADFLAKDVCGERLQASIRDAQLADKVL